MRNLESFYFILSNFELTGGQTYQSIVRRGGKKTRPWNVQLMRDW